MKASRVEKRSNNTVERTVGKLSRFVLVYSPPLILVVLPLRFRVVAVV
ncbi:hypothetical protein ACKFKG_32550 [Phormidesmis sp. 146-35]